AILVVPFDWEGARSRSSALRWLTSPWLLVPIIAVVVLLRLGAALLAQRAQTPESDLWAVWLALLAPILVVWFAVTKIRLAPRLGSLARVLGWFELAGVAALPVILILGFA